MKLKESKVDKKKVKKVSVDKVTKKKKSTKIKKSTLKEVVVIEESKNDPKAQLEQLAKLLKCDHVLVLNFAPGLKKSIAKEKLNFLIEHAFSGGLKFNLESWSKKQAFLGIEVGLDALTGGLPQGNVVVGPEANDLHEVQKFHVIWEKPNCQLRRFQDGKIRESVQIENPYGPAYFSLAKLQFLLKMHLPGTIVTIHQLNQELLTECQVLDKEKEKLRATVDRFVHFLQEVSQVGSLPLRQVRAHCDCLHSGDLSHGHYVSNVVSQSSKVAIDKSGYMNVKEKSEMAPSQTRPVKILLEITLKDRLSTNLFARMRMTYAIALKSLLVQSKLKCMVQRDSNLYLIFKNVLFQVEIQGPNSLLSNEPKNPWKLSSLSEFLNRIGSPNPTWNGLCKLTRQWSSLNGFEFSFATIILDMISASLYFDGGKARPLLGPTSSLEKAFLCFLHKISFTNFAQVPIFLTTPEEFDATSFASKFESSEKRATFPPVCIITPFDVTPSSFTRDMDTTTLTRFVNCARKSLHAFTSNLPNVTFSNSLEVDYSKLLASSFSIAYDVTVYLKPLQIPSTKRHVSSDDDKESTVVSFPVVGYDPVRNFIEEVRESFGTYVNLYFNRSAHTVGIKFVSHAIGSVEAKEISSAAPNKPAFDPVLMVEDLKVLGKGLIKEIQTNF